MDNWFNVDFQWWTHDKLDTNMKGGNLDYTASFELGMATNPLGYYFYQIQFPKITIKLVRKTDKYLRESILPATIFVLASWVNKNCLISLLRNENPLVNCFIFR